MSQRIIRKGKLMEDIAGSVGKPDGVILVKITPLRKLRNFHC